MSTQRPHRFSLPDLSGLDDKLTANYFLSLGVGRGFPPGDAQHFVTGFVRTTEGALLCYERARLRLEQSAANDSLAQYFRGLTDMEQTVMALNRAMRLAERLKESPDTKVGASELPRDVDRDLLRTMRNAIDHTDEPIVEGRAGTGQTLTLFVGTDDMTIADLQGTPRTVRHAAFGGWVSRLHALAVELTNHPDRWTRP